MIEDGLVVFWSSSPLSIAIIITTTNMISFAIAIMIYVITVVLLSSIIGYY